MLVDNELARLSNPDMFGEMGRSLFCLAPSGSGFGNRLKLAIMAGCIPIVVQDQVQAGSLAFL